MVFLISFGVLAMFFAFFCFSKTFLFWLFVAVACGCFVWAQHLWEKHLEKNDFEWEFSVGVNRSLCHLKNFLEDAFCEENEEGEDK